MDATTILRYNSDYGVVICQECHYCIQKSALSSHLIRHKIYRNDRRTLLDSLDGLQIHEPDDVRLPSPGAAPIDGLPTFPGLKCLQPGCGNLCASVKRMRRHLSEVHSIRDPTAPFATEVVLQTFFRGTKIRYFEVARHHENMQGNEADDEAQEMEENELPDMENLIVQTPVEAELDLKALTHFHHFITSTSHTLPAEDQDACYFWQYTFPRVSLKISWLMHGVLAVAAHHKLLLEMNTTAQQPQWNDALHHSQQYLAGWSAAQRTGVPTTESTEVKYGAQIGCILRCCYWRVEPAESHYGIDLESFVRNIQGCGSPDIAVMKFSSCDLLAAASAAALTNLPSPSVPQNSRSPIEFIKDLPRRMADVLPRPDNMEDVLAVLAAVEALSNSCSVCYSADSISTAWTGLISWFRNYPERFQAMLQQHDYAALIVLAHWTLLVKFTGTYCWFLQDASQLLRRLIAARLPQNPVYQDLVDFRQIITPTLV